MGSRRPRPPSTPAPAADEAQARPAPPWRLSMALRLAAFFGLFVLLQSAFGAGQGSALERWVIHDLTVAPAAALIGLLWPDIAVQAVGPRLQAPGGGLNVLNGCEGTDIAFLMVAAMLVAPLAWRWRLLGLVAGMPLVYVANQVRVLLLFHTYRHDRAWFEWVHGLLGPLVLTSLVMAFFLWWMHLFAAPSHRQPSDQAAA